jgi:hypothetical protein
MSHITEFDAAIRRCPLIAILRGVTPYEVATIGAALVEAGFDLIEVPLNPPEPFDSGGPNKRIDVSVLSKSSMAPREIPPNGAMRKPMSPRSDQDLYQPVSKTCPCECPETSSCIFSRVDGFGHWLRPHPPREPRWAFPACVPAYGRGDFPRHGPDRQRWRARPLSIPRQAWHLIFGKT